VKGGKTMTSIKDAACAFLASERIAVTGVSPDSTGHGGGAVYRRLHDRGYQVFAVNPAADEFEGDTCYHTLGDIPGGVGAVVVASTPDQTMATIRECADLGIRYAWMHRAAGVDSVSAQATAYGREHGISVIDGGCPLMFGPAADFGHRLLRFTLTGSGKIPKIVC
jgi:uncharacterized protein